MTDDKHLKGIEKEIDNLEDNDFKENLKVAYNNLKHFAGFSPCEGTWDSNTGKCIEDDETSQPPKVSAGSDQDAKVGDKVQLVGQIKDLKNYAVSHIWTKFSGPAGEDISITADGKSADFTPLKAGEYIFEYTVKDIKGLIGSDQIKINVKDKEEESTSKVQKDLNIDQIFNKEEKPKLTEQDKEKGLDKIVEELDKPILEKSEKPAQKPTTVNIDKVDNNPKVNINEKSQNSKITIKGDKKD